MKNDPLERIPPDEMQCRRAFEEWARSIGMPGKLGIPDSEIHRKYYRSWKACWDYWKENVN